MTVLKKMNHSEYQKALKKKSVDELRFIVKDAREAAELKNENAGYYLDEVHYAAAELQRRFKTVAKEAFELGLDDVAEVALNRAANRG